MLLKCHTYSCTPNLWLNLLLRHCWTNLRSVDWYRLSFSWTLRQYMKIRQELKTVAYRGDQSQKLDMQTNFNYLNYLARKEFVFWQSSSFRTCTFPFLKWFRTVVRNKWKNLKKFQINTCCFKYCTNTSSLLPSGWKRELCWNFF